MGGFGVRSIFGEVWARIRDQLRADFGDAAYECWLKSMSLVDVRGGELRVAVPSLLMRDFITERFGARLSELWSAAEVGIKCVEIIVSPQGGSRPGVLPPPATQEPAAGSDSRPRGGGAADPEVPPALLDERYTFERFLVGKPNALAHSAALRVAESDKVPFNPLFLFGGVGLGKTHLMQAIGWRMLARRAARNVLYLSAETFMNKFVRALHDKTMMEFKDRLRSVDLLMIDDLQFIGRPGATQEEFFHTFNALVDQSRQVVVSADKPPVDLEGMGDRLRSRLSGGVIAEVQPTDFDLRSRVLEAMCDGLPVKIEPRVLEFLAHRITTNLRELGGALISVAMQCVHKGAPITLEQAQDALKDRLRTGERKLSIEDIQRRVAEHFKIRFADMRSERRSLGIVRPRQVAMYLSKQLTTRSLPEIGRMFDRDHTTVIHAVRRVEALAAIDPALREDVEMLRRLLES